MALSRLQDRLLESTLLYDVVQRTAGIEALRTRLSPILERFEPGTLLDVGAGTGAFFDVVPPHVRYTPLDLDPQKLERLYRKHGIRDGIVADASALPLAADSFDYTLCTNVAHHLSDCDFGSLIDGLARVTRRDVAFLDAVRDGGLTGSLLWKLDRGSHPRRSDDLVSALDARLVRRSVERFTVRHTYVLYVGSPGRNWQSAAGIARR
jgi:SAM-dependent methyltransferase